MENIETIFGKDIFDMILGQKEGLPKKPSPEGALLICRELHVKPEECLYLGDTNTDMETGIAAGRSYLGLSGQEGAGFLSPKVSGRPSGPGGGDSVS